jgi:GNAT superfamily N-acetyltransferase
MNYLIRPLTKEDIPQARAVLEAVFPENKEFYLDAYPKHPFPALVAELEQDIVGIAYSRSNTTHPHFHRPMVTVHPNSRRKGIGRKLHDALSYILEPNLGLQTACYQEETDVIVFIQSLGYQLRLDCNIIEVDLKQFNHDPKLPKMFRHLRVIPFTTLFESSKTKQQVFDFLVGRYIDNHAWSPPVPKEHPDWADILEEVWPELSFALMDEDKIIAASSVLKENKNVLDICWSYATQTYGQEKAQTFLKYLLAHQYKEAIKAGLILANMEVDSTDKDKLGLLEWLPIQKQEVWRIFQKAL